MAGSPANAETISENQFINPAGATENENGCEHYKRNCKLVCKCCKKKYICRFCHNKEEDHLLDKKNVQEIECLHCNTNQSVSKRCTECEIVFGKYFCAKCKLFDNQDRQQFHCEGCGLCRVGGRENFFHCDRCQMCLPRIKEGVHRCIDESSQRDCPVCLEDIHTSRIVSHVPPCGHLIHTPCFKDLLNAGFYACPTCGTSMVEMKQIWKKLEEEIENSPMDSEFTNAFCDILCKDCHKKSFTAFHTLGLKCLQCGSFNTAQERGSLVRRGTENQTEDP